MNVDSFYYQHASEQSRSSLGREVRAFNKLFVNGLGAWLSRKSPCHRPDQTFEILAEVEQFSIDNPEWDKQAKFAEARCSFSNGASRDIVELLYGKEIAEVVCGDARVPWTDFREGRANNDPSGAYPIRSQLP